MRRRQLGGFESAEAWTGDSFAYNVVVVLRLSGPLQPVHLEAALAELQQRHPLLAVRLVREGSRWWFEPAPGAVPLGVEERQGDRHWQTAVEEELDHRMDAATAPLARCRLIASPAGDGEELELILSLHHAIADAVSAGTLCRQLLGLCGAAGAGDPAAGAEPAIPAAPDCRFPARFRGPSRWPRVAVFLARRLIEEGRYLWRSRGLRSPAPAGPVRCRVLPVELGEPATTALVRRCRRERVPLNSALNAALLLAVQRHRYEGRALPLRYFAFADLRPYLEPPMGPETLASCLATLRFTVDVGRVERFWALARRIDRQQYRAFRRGEKFLFALTGAGMLRLLIRHRRMRFGSAAVSYTGPLALPAEFGGLRLGGVHAFVSNMPIGAEITAQARLYRGRLWWDLVYLDADMDEAGARAIGADILERLEKAAHERD